MFFITFKMSVVDAIKTKQGGDKSNICLGYLLANKKVSSFKMLINFIEGIK